MKKLILSLILATSPAVAQEPAAVIVQSCLTYGYFVVQVSSPETGQVGYATFRCNHHFTSDKPPQEARLEQKDEKLYL